MTTRLIEECISLELWEEEKHSEYITLRLNKTTILVVDPYAINIEDLINAKPGKVTIVRVRRPLWGQGEVSRFIHKLEVPNAL